MTVLRSFEIVSNKKIGIHTVNFKQKITFQNKSQKKSRIEGCNFGEYPIHKFRYMNYPGPNYLLWAFACGIDEWHKDCFRKRIFSDAFAVEYVQKGVFIFQQNNVTMRVNPGAIFLVHLDQNNTMRCETKFATKKTIIMQGSLLRYILETLGLNRISQIIPKGHEQIDRIFERIYELCEKSAAESRHEISVLCYSLLLELSEQTTGKLYPEALQITLEYIHEHLNEQLSLNELIKYSGVSRATLHRLFKKHLKISPIEYFLDQKLERAKMLLENNLYSIKEVASLLNYASPQYFTSEFKKKYGIPPKNYKLWLIRQER